MRGASKTMRRAFFGYLLVLLSTGSGLAVTASVRRAPVRHRHAAIAAKHTRAHAIARRSRSRHAAHSSYLRASVRIPSQRNAGASPAFPPPAFPAQDEQRIPRQVAPKSAALQGIIRDSTARGIVGAMIALTNRATGATRTISANADGVFRFTDLGTGSYLLLVRSDGFENLTRDDLLLNAGDVVTIELTLVPSPTVAVPASRLPRMAELGPPAPAIESSAAIASYRELRRRPDAEPGQQLVAPEVLPPSQEVFLAMPDRWNVRNAGLESLRPER